MARFASMMLFTFSLMIFSQFVYAEPEEGQFYRIRCASTKKVLSIDDTEKEGPAAIIQVVTGQRQFQHWKFVKVGNYYKIVNRKTGMAINVANASGEQGAPVIQWDANDPGENQQWSLEKKGDFYVIRARHSGQVLDVALEKKDRKAILIQYPYKSGDADNQHFSLEAIKSN
ncbi:MAG: RICIN domain-containing protein [Pirellulales bacterium]